MATLQQALNRDTSRYVVASQTPPNASEPEQMLFPQRSSIQICSLPNLPGTFPSTNSIIDHSFGGKVPQFRAPLPAPSSQGGTTTTTTVFSSSSSSPSGSTNNPPLIQNASTSTPPLNPGAQFQGGILLAKSFLLVTLSVNAPVRVRLYSSQAAQNADSSRDIFTPAGLGTQQGLISDVALDTAPVTWQYCDTVGSNGSTPQNNLIYISVDNIGPASETALISISYVPMQS